MHDKEAQDHIIALEEQLRLAMLAADVDGLDRLIAPGLLFTTHMGEVIGKRQDLDMHRSGLLKFRAIAAAERQVVADARLGVMSARMNLVGSFGGAPFDLDLRCTRIWRAPDHGGQWQFIAGHMSLA
ncbi:nuclear transport factor 2 family protein [Massilia antarctica]|uniref:nuclear transport factor 2 family protein n=1 Tax=Massilia antarctica TaxID=2765360 RepID=UPI0006BB6AFB|nr:nuclear transport factor 2 family protein [Massilia sp. H27-R4]MCY0910175.1 nuclear transport factor 2 family protein [Massilia sp. H27-R4]CUI02732.1 Cytochrome P-450:NADPH-P-450 reductase [Janthinobacterium sp. CG23_2]CUU26518.1 Cytochrome P-450:NADPH-P-450 reductase [Janthinobacterium sp. CG23_2]